MEAIERRALLIAVPVVILLAFYRPADFTTERGTGWQVVIYIVGLASLGIAATLLVIAVAPETFVQLPRVRRERLTFFAFALLGLAVLVIVVLRIYGTYYLHRHGGTIFG